MIRNIAVMAHVDTGKTTLTEQMLRHCGAIRAAGSVDAGTAHTDTLAVERRRGISVHAACVPMQWRDTKINMIDTPGHTDFSAEVERSLWALDGAVLLVSAVDGVMPQTRQLLVKLIMLSSFLEIRRGCTKVPFPCFLISQPSSHSSCTA